MSTFCRHGNFEQHEARVTGTFCCWAGANGELQRHELRELLRR